MTGRAGAADAVLAGPAVARSAPLGVPGLVRERSGATPNAVALVDPDVRLTYRELEHASDAVARSLRRAGGRPGDPVVVEVERSAAMVVAMLGALKAGMPYLPLTALDPQARRLALVRRARARFALVVADNPPAPAGLTTLTVDVHAGADAQTFDELREYGPANSAYALFTSGSTGEPKGVVVPTTALCNRLLWMRDEYRFAAGDRILQKTPSTFDVSGWEIWGPLVAGAQCVLMPPGGHRDPGLVVDWVTGHAVTIAHFVPSMLDEFLRWPGSERCRCLRLVVCSGEPLPADYVRRFRERLPETELYNLYGPTEAAIDVTHWRCPPEPDRVLIGRPIDNCTLAVVDDDLGPVPPGRVGQLVIGGVPLATGYLHRPDLTAAAFVPAPDWCPVDRLYLTGDLVRLRGDDLEFVGRRDNQVKIRGHRVELAEVERAMRDQPGVRQAAVVAVAQGNRAELCGFVVADPGEDGADPAPRLRALLRERLPDAYVPARILPIAELPLTGSGKLDRTALVDRARKRPPEPAGGTPAGGTPVDELSAYWADALGGGQPVDPEQGFVTAGGHSLAAARLAGQVLSRWGVRLPLSDLLRDNLSLVSLRAMLGRASPDGLAAAAGPPVGEERTGWAPISPEQRRLWWWTQVFPESPAYNVVGVMEVAARLDPAVLARACAALAERYEVLRTTFERLGDATADGPAAAGDPAAADRAALPDEPVRQRIHPAAEPALRHADAGDRPWPAAIRDFASTISSTVFRPDRPPRMVVGLLRSAEQRSCVVMCLDHLVADQVSLDLLLDQLSEAYRRAAGSVAASAVPAPAAAVAGSSPQYADLVRSAQRSGEPDRRERDLEFWRRRLRGSPRYLDLPFRRARPPVPTFTGAAVHADLGDTLRSAARRHAATPATLALAAYAQTLAAWSGTTDLVIGVPISTRRRVEELDAVGLFLRTVPVRVRLPDGASTTELVDPVRDALLDAHQHDSVTFDEIVAASGAVRDLGYNPLFQVWFNDLSQARAPHRFAGHPCTGLDPPADAALFDLGFYLLGSAERGHRARLVYADALWDREIAEEFLRQCRDNLRSLAPRPGHASPGGRRAPATPPPSPQRPATCRDLVESVIGHAVRTPDRVAISADRGAVTYRELERLLREVGGRVRAAVPPGRAVAVTARRDAGLAAAVLGCWHAGRSPLVLPGDAPAGWSAAVDAVATRLEAVPDAPAAAGPPEPWPATATGHVLSTSGTSGSPALVSLPADALPAVFGWYAAELALDAADVFCFTVPPAHDPMFRDLILPLTLGARVRIPTAVTPGTLLATLLRAEATVWHTTPSQAALALAAAAPPGGLPGLRRVVFHGEPLTDRIAEAVSRLAPAATVDNLYGTTETPQASGLYRWRRPAPGTWQEHRASVPVGRAGDRRLPRTLAVVGPDGRTAQVGQVGELVVTGNGLALGYLGDSPRPGPVERDGAVRAYPTGDLARLGPDGTVEIVGRRDRQAIVHGYRVELAGVERVLADLPGVAACVVAPDSRRTGELTAWLVAGASSAGTDLARLLRARLPEWAVPTRLVRVERIPLTGNGKPDVAALQAAEALAAEPAPPVPLGSAASEPDQVLDELLDLVRTLAPNPERVAADTSFFDAGLTSLSLLRLHDRLTRRPAAVTLAELFRFPTPRSLATYLSGSQPLPSGRRAVARRGAGDAERQTEIDLRRAARTRHRVAGQDFAPTPTAR